MVNTINSKTDLQFAGQWLANTFNQPILTKKAKLQILQGKLKQARQSQQDLQLILNKWTWQGHKVKTANEFITKFGQWIKNKGWQDLENEVYELQQENKQLNQKLEKRRQLEAHFNGQIRDIYLLFDPSKKNYEVIDYMSLWKLLEGVAERERERERLGKLISKK